jgi:hypothetical protein
MSEHWQYCMQTNKQTLSLEQILYTWKFGTYQTHNTVGILK